MNLIATSFVLNPSREREFGCDAAIILANGNELKVCLFEAKWPRFKTKLNYWDSRQKQSGLSHFHEQLRRQKDFARHFSIWEVIYCEYDFGLESHLYPDFGSTCIWFKDAHQADRGRKSPRSTWTDKELQELMTPKYTIGEMIEDSCFCLEGERMSSPYGSDYQSFLGSVSEQLDLGPDGRLGQIEVLVISNSEEEQTAIEDR